MRLMRYTLYSFKHAIVFCSLILMCFKLSHGGEPPFELLHVGLMQQELPTELIIAVERILEPNKEYRPVHNNVQDTLNELFPNGWSLQSELPNPPNDTLKR